MATTAGIGTYQSIAVFVGHFNCANSIAAARRRNMGRRKLRRAFIAAGSALRNHLIPVWHRDVTTRGVSHRLAVVHDSFAVNYLLFDYFPVATAGLEARGGNPGFAAGSKCLRGKCYLFG